MSGAIRPRLLTVAVMFCVSSLSAQDRGTYRVREDQPQQVIKGLGFEIQSDSIGSGNSGMPEEVIAVPHDLSPAERTRFYKEMLHGFRYARLAMGLYLRGLDTEQKHIIERYPGQMNDLEAMQDESGIEGFDVEYWSPAPFWKRNKSYYGGTIAQTDGAFLNDFSDAIVQDLRYLQSHGLRVSMWGLQNEPFIRPPKPKTASPDDTKQAFATCPYTPVDYYKVMQAAAPKVRALLPKVHIHAPSWDGPAGEYAAELRKDPALMKDIDAWTWHQIGHNSNDQIDLQAKYLQGAEGKPVYQNEFEYQPWGDMKVEDYFMNTGQALMNWLVFENSPAWFWIHALKPVSNMEATGYALGFWRPAGELKQNLRPNLKPGYWEFNPRNWNAIAGFLKYMPWDSRRLTVEENTVRHDQRILVWHSQQGRVGVALSNRGERPFTFHVSGLSAASLVGHRYTVSKRNIALGTVRNRDNISITVPPQSFEFWLSK